MLRKGEGLCIGRVALTTIYFSVIYCVLGNLLSHRKLDDICEIWSTKTVNSQKQLALC